ncbi:MAG TPA: membrane or secreted protein, partial [Flavobacterium sp.]|nr:membrane or secreted protein [Flavobacterium sp.]
MKRTFLIFFLFLLQFQHVFSQASTYVDENGVFRWVKSKKEVRIFGINYTLPFAHGYRAINYLNKNHKEAIDKDVYHIARLGVTGHRVHIWDAEVTDSLGNLISSPQLDLLDYTIAKLKERGIKTIITPIKVGGNGYPEIDQPAPGFTNTLDKLQTYSGDIVINKQKRYLTQLLQHINPYTNIAYNSDPDIIALEITNEPIHNDAEIATQYINTMVEAIKMAGFKNPIFYNVSEKSKLIDAYLKANIDGCTFQWYPTGLVQNNIMPINFLPNVDKYTIPFQDKKAFQNKARIIYEFDPGDTNLSTLYPAMARSFRLSKFQFAAQFAYDAIDLAHNNTEYQTHYLNLAYTPSKAISLKIASQVFQEVNSNDNFGNYPENTKFKNTQLNTATNVAVYNSDSKFFYTNTTEIIPKDISKIKHIAGVGNSNIVKYSGTGAYFL